MWGALAGASLLIGAALALRFTLSNRMIGAVMGFGSGALISSIAYELVPESLIGSIGNGLTSRSRWARSPFRGRLGDRSVPAAPSAKSIAGQHDDGSGTAIFLGTLLDGVPESLVLAWARNRGLDQSRVPDRGVHLERAGSIAGTRALVASGHSPRRVFWMWSALVLARLPPRRWGFAIVQAVPSADGQYGARAYAGAVLTMLSDVMMPEAFEHGGKVVGLLATLGFLTAAVLSVME
jgi:ZIP family zinc transporter